MRRVVVRDEQCAIAGASARWPNCGYIDQPIVRGGMEKSGLVNSEGELTSMSEQWIRLSVEDQFVM